MAVDQALAERVRSAISEQALQRGLVLRERYMFGGLAFMLKNKMTCGVLRGELMVRVGPAGYGEALGHDHTRPMDFTGRPMRGYIFVGPDGCDSPSAVEYWVERAACNIEALISAAPTRGPKSSPSITKLR